MSNPTILDQIWINKLFPYTSGILNVDFTDHLPTFLHLVTERSFIHAKEKIKVSFRSYSQSNFDLLCSKLENIEWDEVFRISNTNELVENFIRVINTEYCKTFTLKTKNISEKRLKNPWISQDVMRLIRQKSEYFRLYRIGIISRETNNRFKNKVNKVVRKARDNYHLNRFNSIQTNKALTWNQIGDIMGNKSKNKTIDELVVDGVSFSNKVDIANKFNEYFCEIGNKLESELPPSDASPLNYLPSVTPFFKLFQITEVECSRVVLNLKNTKSEINYLPVHIFKKLGYILIKPLTKLINRCFNAGVFPDCFKIGRVTQIHKSGDRSDPSNYRPITTLPYISKIFETCLCNRLVSYFEKFSLLTSAQYGFRKKRSTHNALIHLTKNIYSSLNSKEFSLSVLIDYRKAFDTVSHSVLLNKLAKYGIRGNALKLFESYLANRKQYVAIGEVSSASLDFTIGIPQGSCLGPFLFLVYVNDFPRVSSLFDCILFADDTTINMSHKDYNILVSQLKNELVRVKEWTISNRLT